MKRPEAVTGWRFDYGVGPLAAIMPPARTVRQLDCTGPGGCGQESGLACSSNGDHLARWQKAADMHLISRTILNAARAACLQPNPVVPAGSVAA